MVGVLIVAHGALGEALIHGASHVLGKRPLQVQQLGVTVHDDPDAILPQAQELARQLDSGDGVRVLTYRDEPLAAVLDKAMSGGRDGVVHLNSDACNAASGS